MPVDSRPQLERELVRALRFIKLVGVAWVALCGLLGAGVALHLTRPQEPSC